MKELHDKILILPPAKYCTATSFYINQKCIKIIPKTNKKNLKN